MLPLVASGGVTHSPSHTVQAVPTAAAMPMVRSTRRARGEGKGGPFASVDGRMGDTL